MKKSKIKRLVSKKLAQRLATERSDGQDFKALVQREGAVTIARMRAKGYDLVSCLETGEGIFVAENHVVGLHIQLPTDLYRRLETQCRNQQTTKRNIVVDALDKCLP